MSSWSGHAAGAAGALEAGVRLSYHALGLGEVGDEGLERCRSLEFD